MLVTIGLDVDVVQRLRERLEARVVAYPAVPRLYSLDGHVRVESASVAGRWLEPAGVVFYGYFEDAAPARRALALASTPTFGDLRRRGPDGPNAIGHPRGGVRDSSGRDDQPRAHDRDRIERLLTLTAAVRAQEAPPPRGYLSVRAR